MNHNEIEIILRSNPDIVAQMRFDKEKRFIVSFFRIGKFGNMETRDKLTEKEAKELLKKAIKGGLR